jgi:hypothetical protein
VSRSADWLLRLDADDWLLRTAVGVRRQAHDGTPAPALERLATDLQGRGARLQVVLGDGWLRYLVLHWPPGVRAAEERQAFMAHRFRTVHELTAPDWAFALDRDAVDFPALACAAPASLIAALHAFAQARGVRLRQVAGDFVDRFNHLRQRFDEAPGTLCALAVASGARLTVGLWRDGAWHAVRSRAIGDTRGASFGGVSGDSGAESGGELGGDSGGDRIGPAGGAELSHMLEGWRAELAPAQEGVVYAVGIVPAASAGWRVAMREAP